MQINTALSLSAVMNNMRKMSLKILKKQDITIQCTVHLTEVLLLT